MENFITIYTPLHHALECSTKISKDITNSSKILEQMKKNKRVE
jgi:hypothetical protein